MTVYHITLIHMVIARGTATTRLRRKLSEQCEEQCEGCVEGAVGARGRGGVGEDMQGGPGEGMEEGDLKTGGVGRRERCE